ncbi:MAG: vitamin K epoxide reductase family protein [Acidobacteria bacterium]|nr:vitamin K epoxide reductase family protein [Acidobacteriota bacterium]
MSKLSRTLLMAFAALGLGAASASSYVHYHLLTDPSYSSFCDVNATVNCTQAYLSSYGSLFGVPVALFGVFFFTLVLDVLHAVRGDLRLCHCHLHRFGWSDHCSHDYTARPHSARCPRSSHQSHRARVDASSRCRRGHRDQRVPRRARARRGSGADAADRSAACRRGKVVGHPADHRTTDAHERGQGVGRDLQRFSVSALSRRARRLQTHRREARRRSAGPLRAEAFPAGRGVQLVRPEWRP